MLKRTVKAAGLVALSVTFVLAAGAARRATKGFRRRRFSVRITSFFSRWVRELLNVQVEIEGRSFRDLPQPCLILANHLSYLDVLILAAAVPSVFVTSVELEESLFLGRISKLAGSLFVERRRRTQVRRQVEALARILREGFRVVLFPEGTSSDGETLLSFKSGLIEATRLAHCAVVPVRLRYKRLDGAVVTPANRDRIFYYGEMGFFRHLWGLLAAREISVSVSVLEPLLPHHGHSRKELSGRARSQIAQRYPVLAP